MSKLKFLFLILLFVTISLKYGGDIRGIFIQNTNIVISSYIDLKTTIKHRVSEHFYQQEQIQELRVAKRDLESSAELLSAFETKLNDILKIHNIEEYDPRVRLVRSIAYVNLNNPHRVWIDYAEFNTSRIYGLLDRGNSAGIVVEHDGSPMALLLGDPKSIFSVFVGEERIPGVVKGGKNRVHVRYIPLWMNPKVGDEVVTSGLDGIFFGGVRVGVVVEVIKEELSITAVLRPFSRRSVPSYYHIIEQN